jgi:hypothetical protein
MKRTLHDEPKNREYYVETMMQGNTEKLAHFIHTRRL